MNGGYIFVYFDPNEKPFIYTVKEQQKRSTAKQNNFFSTK